LTNDQKNKFTSEQIFSFVTGGTKEDYDRIKKEHEPFLKKLNPVLNAIIIEIKTKPRDEVLLRLTTSITTLLSLVSKMDQVIILKMIVGKLDIINERRDAALSFMEDEN